MLGHRRKIAQLSMEELKAIFTSLVIYVGDYHLTTPNIDKSRDIKSILTEIIVALDFKYPLLIKRTINNEQIFSYHFLRFKYKLYSVYFSWRIRNNSSSDFLKQYEESHSNLMRIIHGLNNEDWEVSLIGNTGNNTLTIEDLFITIIPSLFDKLFWEVIVSVETKKTHKAYLCYEDLE